MLLVHFADFLDVDIPTALWSEVVERCRFEAMKSQHEASEILNLAFPEGATAFFNQGTNGRWRARLSEAQLRRHEQLADERLPEDAALWLEHGSLDPGQGPSLLRPRRERLGNADTDQVRRCPTSPPGPGRSRARRGLLDR